MHKFSVGLPICKILAVQSKEYIWYSLIFEISFLQSICLLCTSDRAPLDQSRVPIVHTYHTRHVVCRTMPDHKPSPLEQLDPSPLLSPTLSFPLSSPLNSPLPYPLHLFPLFPSPLPSPLHLSPLFPSPLPSPLPSPFHLSPLPLTPSLPSIPLPIPSSPALC